jgi:N6-adenosine-specific RNA methylase IME4
MKKYNLILTDPPWQQTKGNVRKCRPNQGKKLDYETLPLEEIKEIHKRIFNDAEEIHNVFMWTVDKYLHEAEKMMADLGYTLHARMIWNKENGVCPAFTVRFSHEYLLWFYRKGKMLMPSNETKGKFTTVFSERSTKHSKKPVCAYEMLEEMFPNAVKLELFARERREGWTSMGNEIDGKDLRA